MESKLSVAYYVLIYQGVLSFFLCVYFVVCALFVFCLFVCLFVCLFYILYAHFIIICWLRHIIWCVHYI